MNLKELFEIQAGLDFHIEKNHPPKEGEDRIQKKVLALQVELGEFVNELPEVFKFWSYKKNNYEKALEEYIDGIHFFLSIGNYIGVNKEAEYGEGNTHKSVMTLLALINKNVADAWWHYSDNKKQDFGLAWLNGFNRYLWLGELLGFTEDMIVQAYLEKNSENHRRQLESY